MPKASKKIKDNLTNSMFDGEDLSGGYTALATLPPLEKIYDYILVDDEEKMKAMMRRVLEAEIVAIDSEFGGAEDVNPLHPDSKLAGISLAIEDPTSMYGVLGYYIPTGHLGDVRQVPIERARELLKPLSNVKFVAHNAKIEKHSIERELGFTVNIVFETLIAALYLNFMRKGLKDLTINELERDVYDFKLLMDRSGQAKLRRKDIRYANIDDVAQYAAADAINTLSLYNLFKNRIPESSQFSYQLDIDSIPMLAAMEHNGMPIDASYFGRIMDQFRQEIAEIDEELYAIAGERFNVNANQQLGRILYGNLQLKVKEKTATGQPSTSAKVLKVMLGETKADETEWQPDLWDDEDEFISPEAAMVRLLIKEIYKDQTTWMPEKPSVHPDLDAEWVPPQDPRPKQVDFLTKYLRRSELAKIVSTYDMRNHAVPQQRYGSEQLCVHTSFNLHVARTGRLTSTGPNLQNVGARTREGLMIRSGFVAPEGWVFVSADKSQIEPRIFAYFVYLVTGDDTLLKSYQEGKDIYKTIGALALHKLYDEINKSERTAAKTLVLALIYLSSAETVAESPLTTALGLTAETAEEAIENLYKRAPGARLYQMHCAASAISKGYIETGWGFRRYLDKIQYGDRTQVREAVNSTIQGTAAQFMKAALVWLYNLIIKYELSDVIKPVLQIHDEIVALVRVDHLQIAETLFRHVLTKVVDIGASMKSDIEIGRRWGDLVDIKELENNPDLKNYIDQFPSVDYTQTLCHSVCVECSPYKNTPWSALFDAVDYDEILVDELEPYIEAAYYIKQALPHSSFGTIEELTGYIFRDRAFVSKKGNYYYRAVMACRDGFIDLISFDEPLMQGMHKITGEWSTYNGRMNFRVDRTSPIDTGLGRYLETGTPVTLRGIYIDMARLRKDIDRASSL